MLYDLWTSIDWATTGEWVAAALTLCTLLFAIRLANRAVTDQKVDNWTAMQASRLSAACSRAIAYAIGKKDMDEDMKKYLKAIEDIDREIVEGYIRHNTPGAR